MSLQRILSDKHTDYIVKARSEGKMLKEQSMKNQFEARFLHEIENTFRCLKTDLDLRPIYHKNDDSTMAHLHLGLLAYWVVNTIRYQLKAKGINSGWQEIQRKTNTQKIITTTGQNSFEQTIQIKRCSQPNTQVEKIYSALGYENYPFVKRKYVVPKSELKKMMAQLINQLTTHNFKLD